MTDKIGSEVGKVLSADSAYAGKEIDVSAVSVLS